MSGGLLGFIDNQVNKRGTNLLPKRYRPVREAYKFRFERRFVGLWLAILYIFYSSHFHLIHIRQQVWSLLIYKLYHMARFSQ